MSTSGGIPAQGGGTGTVNAQTMGFSGASWTQIFEVGDAGDNASGTRAMAVGSILRKSNSLFDTQRTPDVFKIISTVAVGAEVTIWTPAGGKKFRLMGFALALSAATTLTIKDNTAGTTIFRLLLAAGGPGITQRIDNGILSAAANNVLTATSGAAANLDGVVWGIEE